MIPEAKSIEEVYSSRELNPQGQIVLSMSEKEEINSIDIDITLHKKYKEEIQALRNITESTTITSINEKKQ